MRMYDSCLFEIFLVARETKTKKEKMGKLFKKMKFWQNGKILPNGKIEKILRMKSGILIGGLSLTTVGAIILLDYYRRKIKRNG